MSIFRGYQDRKSAHRGAQGVRLALGPDTSRPRSAQVATGHDGTERDRAEWHGGCSSSSTGTCSFRKCTFRDGVL